MQQNRDNNPTFLLVGGLTMDFLLLVLLLSLVRVNRFNIRRAENIQNLYKLVFDHSPDYLFVKDASFTFIDINKAYKTLFPKDKRDKIIGATSALLTPENVTVFSDSDRKAMDTGFSETLETVGFVENGPRRMHTLKVRFQDTYGNKYILGMARDVTEREHLIEQLTASNSDLEQFAHVASHDMQEPLRMIRAFSELIAADNKDKLDKTGHEYFGYIMQGVDRLEGLIQSLLTYARLNHGQEPSKPVNLLNKARKIKTSFSVGAHLKNATLQLKIPKDITVMMPPVRLARVLENMVSNGMKYQPKNKPEHKPKVRISVRDAGDVWRVEVTDNGIGIPEDKLQSVFLPFKRLHAYDTYAGSGIGLAQCQKIVRDWGGDIGVTSRPGRGSTFWFTIPKARAAA